MALVRVDRQLARVDRQRRAVDLLISATLLGLTLPVIAALALVSAVSLRAWPFFTQDRVGRNGELFRFLKIRTLPVDAPGYASKHQLDQATIPAVCKLIRRLHLDELPQLLLVLRGQMSLVGPRPEMACLHDEMPASFRELRTSVRPGCTGLWQISESCTDLIAAAPDYDRIYIEHRSLRLDLWILARTARKMLGGTDHLSLDRLPTWVLPEGAEVAVLSDQMVTLPATAAR